MWKVPKTFEGAEALNRELQYIKDTDPEYFYRSGCTHPETNYGFGVDLRYDGDRQNFDFSDLHYGEVTCYSVSLHKDWYYVNLVDQANIKDSWVCSSEGRSCQIALNRWGAVRAHVHRETLDIERMVLRVVQNLNDDLLKKLFSLFSLRKEDILGTIEGLWLAGYQFDEYLPGSFGGEILAVDGILDIIHREDPLLHVLRDYYRLHIIKPDIQGLYSDESTYWSTYDEAIADMDDRIRRRTQLAQYTVEIGSGARSRSVDALYSIVARED